MNRTEIAPGIMVYKNVLRGETTLDKQVEFAMGKLGLAWEPAYVRSNEENIIDTNSRDTGSFYINHSDHIVDNYKTPIEGFASSLSNLFLQKFQPLQQDYKDYYQTTTNSHESYGLLKYGIGQNFVNHIDDYNNTRKISMVYYMNDDYIGGEILFPRFNISHKPEADEMIMFPSTYVYNHSVLPVTEGTRYAVVSWLK